MKTITVKDFQLHHSSIVKDFAKQSETYMQEMLALAHKVDRHEQWIMKVAQASDVKLAT